jgi:1-deoxy-D-xylulose-5-phosphate reductoisomerase
MKNIVLLGSTGSIGENALKVVEQLSSRLQVVGIAVEKSFVRALEQAKQFGIKRIAVADPVAAEECRLIADSDVEILAGSEGLVQLAAQDGVDIVVSAVVGMAGLAPVLAAVENGTDVALATKEVLVSAGSIVMDACDRTGARLLPVDSEHSAIHQCGVRRGESGVKRIVLTASGGPFRDKPDVDFDNVAVEEALNHPNWDMGKKVTIDSATLMNKGLELIEAHWLFGVPIDSLDVVVHPESLIHSFVEFVDGSMLAQLGMPDMRLAIQYALLYPERVDGALPRLDLTEMGSLNFGKPDEDRFPCLRLAREAAIRGGTTPAAMNAANEIAVQAFLDDNVPFSSIWGIVEKVMNSHDPVMKPVLDEIMAADSWAREEAKRGL